MCAKLKEHTPQLLDEEEENENCLELALAQVSNIEDITKIVTLLVQLFSIQVFFSVLRFARIENSFLLSC